MDRNDLIDVVIEAIRHLGGSGTIVDIARFIWEHHEDALRDSGELFFTWQYDMRWAAQRLSKQNLLVYERVNGTQHWRLI